MKIPHDKFCVLPWVSIEASPIGTVRPCCLATDEILDDDGNKFKLNQAGFQEIQNSQTADAKPLMFLDLKLGNICNLKCRICGSWSSSQFATEELNFIIDKEEKKNSFHYQMLRDGAWPRESEQFWAQLDSAMGEVRYIEFTGGEPFMIREHFDLLKKLVEKNYAHQIEIHYNTNGTQYPEEAEEIWQ